MSIMYKLVYLHELFKARPSFHVSFVMGLNLISKSFMNIYIVCATYLCFSNEIINSGNFFLNAYSHDSESY